VGKEWDQISFASPSPKTGRSIFQKKSLWGFYENIPRFRKVEPWSC